MTQDQWRHFSFFSGEFFMTFFSNFRENTKKFYLSEKFSDDFFKKLLHVNSNFSIQTCTQMSIFSKITTLAVFSCHISIFLVS